MLEHALVLNAKEVMQEFTIAAYGNSQPEGRRILEKPYVEIINGQDAVSDAIIKGDRNRLRTLLKPGSKKWQPQTSHSKLAPSTTN